MTRNRCNSVAICFFVTPALAIAVIAAGCGGASDASVDRPARIKLASGETAKIDWDGKSATSIATDVGQTAEFVDGEAAIGDELVIQLLGGQVEVHRKPNVVVNEINALPYLYLKEESLEELVTDGFKGEPHVGPDKQLYWTARTCMNPQCDSQSIRSEDRPYLFISRLAGVSVSETGTVTTTKTGPGSYLVPCPVCKQFEHVVQFELPSSSERKKELTGELSRARAARDRVMKSK